MNAAERIYVASTREGESPSRLAEELARRVEDDIAARDLPAGSALGTLRKLSERYAAGRSVIREAVGLLERRGLGRLRPGPCGGFILAKPQPQAIGEQLADYFRCTGITLRQLMDAREAVDLMAARLAATVTPSAADLVPLRRSGSADSLGDELSARIEIARLAGEPVLLPFVECLNSLTTDFRRTGAPAPTSRDSIGGGTMCEALRSGDIDAAVAEAARAHRGLAERLTERSDSTHSRTVSVSGTASGTASGTISITAAHTTSRMPSNAAEAPASGTLASAIARELAADIARRGSAGARLGSEWALCERFNVSRLTVRQAIRLLEDSGLVECRRGRGNGLIVRDRRAAGSIRLVLAYLIGERMDPMSAGTILFQLNCFVPALAVSRADETRRRQLQAALSRVEASDPFDRYDLLCLVQCVSRVADSPIIDLFSRCLAAYEARFRPSLAQRLPASAHRSYFRLVRGLLERMPIGNAAGLAQAKAEAAALMLEMSRSRPI